MEKFNRVLRGYDPNEVNAFLDKVIEQVETMISEMKQKDETIKSLRNMEQDYINLKQKYAERANMEDTLKRAIIMAEKTSEQIKLTAYQERDIILNDAKKNANIIVNEALLKSERIESEANKLRRNVIVFKKKLKDALQTQLELVDDIEKIELE